MTLNEAIKHCEEVAQSCELTNKQHSLNHKQLAEWLIELKERRQKDIDNDFIDYLENLNKDNPRVSRTPIHIKCLNEFGREIVVSI